MIEKDYYRLSELEKKFGFSEYDYIYLCEQFNNPIRFYVYSHYFLITKPTFTEVEVFGVASYKGVISLKPNDRKRLLQDNKVDITECSLTKKTSITMLESASDILVQNCLSSRYVIQPLSFDNVSDVNINAKIIDEKNRGMVHTETEMLTASLSLQLKDMVVTEEDVTWAKGHLFKVGFKPDKEENTEKKVYIFHEYIKGLMKLHPRKGAAALWNFILKKVSEEDDLIDPYFLIREISPKNIIWGVENEPDRTMTKGTFQNLVSELKKTN